MTKEEALKLALEALHGFIPYLPLNDEAQCGRYDEAITAIKKALAQPEQEPVGKLQEATAERAWFTIDELNAWADKKLSENPHWVMPKDAPERDEPPPQRPWVGLTDDELLKTYGWDFVSYGQSDRPSLGPSILDEAKQEIIDGLRKVEAKLKEKNT